ncbi:MAG TPA: hypothetical protein VHM67_13150 [Gemmatimonadaceae bacterium]|nr:hypothetical protein [Gemmatimonadaceae bacterium]
MSTLWSATSQAKWREALDRYDAVIAAQGVKRLAELDRWYQDELPPAIARRRPAHVTHDELVKASEWKMARGVFRARNLVLVKGNDAGVVVKTSTDALSRIPDPKAPIATLAKLDGVGPATASAIAAAAAPEIYPFLDELVAAQIPGLGAVAFTMTYYARYADALRSRAAELGKDWTPVLVEKALWANSGGKVALRK